MERTRQDDPYVNFLSRRRWLIIALSLLVMLACAYRADQIAVSNEYRVLFGDHNPQLAAYDELTDTYAASDTVVIAVAPESGNVFTRATFGAIEALTDAAWRLPYSNRVDSLTNHIHSEVSEDDPDELVVGPLVEDANSLADADLEEISEIALNSSEVAGRLVARDGRVAGMVVNFVVPKERQEAVDAINDHLEAMIADARERYSDIDFYVAGEMVINRAFSRVTESEFQILIPLTFLIMAVVSCLLLRSLLCPLSVLLLIFFTVGTTMGIAGWAGVVLNPISAYVPVVVMAITVTYSVHIVTGTLAGMRNGLGKIEAIVDSVRVNLYPVFLTSLTTAIGFLSLNFAELPPFHTLGNFVAVGVVCIFVYSVTLLPALLAVLPLRTRARKESSSDLYHRLADFIIARRTVLLWSVATVSLLFVTGMTQVELDDNFIKYFDERHEVRRDTDFIINNLTGMETQEYSLESGERGITDPDYLAKIDAFAQWYRGQPGVRHVWVFADVMKRLNRNMNGDDPEYYRLPEQRELAAQYLLLYELSLPFGQDLNNIINVEKTATRMIVTFGDLSTREQRELAAKGHAWLQANAPEMASEAAGLAVVMSHLAERNIQSMLYSTAIAMAIVSAILFLVFRSFRFGLISLVPNFLPAAMSLGLWGYIIGNVGVASAVFIIIAFGIVVDDTIHFLTKYLKARREDGRSPPDAIRYTFGTVGRALWTTTLVLALGFLTFAVSGFQPNWSLGLLMAVSVTFALATDFLLLPSLLLLIDRNRTLQPR